MIVTTIVLTTAIAAPFGFLVGSLMAGSKTLDAKARADDAEERLAYSELGARHTLESQRRTANELYLTQNALEAAQAKLDRLTDRDERGRFVRREAV